MVQGLRNTSFFIRSGRRPAAACASVAAALVVAASGSAACAQPKGKAAAGEKTISLFAVEHTGLASMMVDKKDENLKKALGMFRTRLHELPLEMEEFRQIPMPIVDMVLGMITQPGRVAVTFSPDSPDPAGMGIGLVLSSATGDQQAASTIHGQISSLIAMAQPPEQPTRSATFTDMSEFAAPFAGVVRYGPRKAADGWRYELHAGAMSDPDGAFAPLHSLPKVGGGFAPFLSARMDARALGPIIKTFLPFAGPGQPQVEEMLGKLEKAGFIGENAVRFSSQCGYTETESVSYSVMEGMKPFASHSGISTTPLKSEHFAMIPSDATVAMISSFDMSNMVEMLDQAQEANPEVAEMIEQFHGATGVDPVNDLLHSVGNISGFYMSESTGSGMASAVFFVQISDRATFEQAHTKLVGFANSMLASEEEVRGHIRIRPWSDGDTNLYSITFPGLPIPVEVTYALVGDWLVGGMTPQAAIAATRQIAGRGDKGIRSNESFKSAFPGGNDVTSFTFIDTPRVMRDGYQYVSLAGSAIANAMRSSIDGQREPGLIVPIFSELKAGARPMISYKYWKGDDYISESHSDRSMIVNATGAVGAAAPFIPLIAAVGAAVLPEMGRHMEEMGDSFGGMLLPGVPGAFKAVDEPAWWTRVVPFGAQIHAGAPAR